MKSILLLALVAGGLLGVPSTATAAPGCVGAAAMMNPACPPTRTGPLTPDPAVALLDSSAAYDIQPSTGDDCFSNAPAFPVRTCHFGDRRSKVTVAITGNSHAGAWLPAVQEVARQRGWHVVTYLGSGCSPAPVYQNFESATRACRDWASQVSRRLITDHPDVVLLVTRLSRSIGARDIEQSKPLYRAAYRWVFRRWAAAGVPAVILKDNPVLFLNGLYLDGPKCLAANPTDYSVCQAPRRDSTPSDPAPMAARDVAFPRIAAADLTDVFCTATLCPAAVGGMTVYRDSGHLTATYARTVAPYLAPLLDAALRTGRVRPVRIATADFGGVRANPRFLSRVQVAGIQRTPARLKRHLRGSGITRVRTQRGADSLPVMTRRLFVESVAGPPRTVVRFDRDQVRWSVINLDTTRSARPGRAVRRALAAAARERAVGRTVAFTGLFGGNMERTRNRFRAAGFTWAGRGRAGVVTPRGWQVSRVSVEPTRDSGAPRRWVKVTLTRG